MTAPAMTTTLHDAAMRLAVAREELAQRKAAWKARYDRFLSDFADEKALLDASETTVGACEADVRGLALVAHETGAALCGGVSVVQTTELMYSETVALEWAKEKGLCLVPERLDVKAFEKIAKVSPLPFVSITQRPSVRISSDMLAKLGES